MAGRFSSVAQRSARGFTLIEILLVLLLIGIIIGVAVVVPKGSGPKQMVESEATRLQVLLEQGRERALLENRELGLALVGADAYEWMIWSEEDEKWLLLDELSYRRHRLPEGVVINNLNQQATPINAGLGSDADSPKPTWILFTDTQMTPVQVEFMWQADNRQREVLESDGIGPVVML